MAAPILDTGVVALSRSQHDLDRIKDEVVKDSLANYSDQGFANFNLSSFEAQMDPLTGDPIVRHTRMSVRPEKQAVMHFDIIDLTLDQIEDLPRTLNGLRLDETAAPFVGAKVDFERPEGAVLHSQDMYVFDESMEYLLQDTAISLELIADDINRTKNIPKHELDWSLIEGIDDLKKGKEEVSSNRKEYLMLASRILRAVGMNVSSTDDLLTEKTDHEVYVYAEQRVRAQADNKHMSRELFDDLELLYRYSNDITNRLIDVELFSRDTLRESVSPSAGFWLPQIVGTPDEAVDSFGIGSLDWLLL